MAVGSLVSTVIPARRFLTAVVDRMLRRSFTAACSTNDSSSSSSSTSRSSHSATTAWQRTALRCKNPHNQNHLSPYIQEIRHHVNDSPALHLKSLEKELQSAIGQALGRQGQKVVQAIRVVHDALRRYYALVEEQPQQQQHSAGDSRMTTSTTTPTAALQQQQQQQQQQEAIDRYNAARQVALTARWELMVHRQAAGFVVNNHSVVVETFPIPGPLVAVALEEDDDDDNDEEHDHNDDHGERKSYNKKIASAAWTRAAAKLQPTDETRQPYASTQLDWWQRVGRWR